MTHKVVWLDLGLEPRQPPNPKYPRGIDIDVSANAERTCTVLLPYPAKRIGHYMIKCDDCGAQMMVTTAGRVDDPRSIKLGCER